MMIEFIKENWIEIIGAIVGLLYLYFEYKAHILMWPTGIIMSSFYTIVFIQATFYAFASINIYYILAGIYGWIMWRRSPKEPESSSVGILRTPTRLYLPILLSIIILYAIILYVLATFTDSQVLYGDSFVTTLSIVAMWMLARKYAEQWLLLIVVNIVSVFLYLYQDLYPTSIMYLVYAVVSVFGYIRWKKLIIA
ncbi:MAG: nicotinamide riboside transporter PnuC [Dysgonomonas sp.]|nr:nicotinamide riboside transporter PnuC [Dysgonomonas sp.]